MKTRKLALLAVKYAYSKKNFEILRRKWTKFAEVKYNTNTRSSMYQ